ncbi:class I SAM-dependent DNA methyltransferase [Aphanizomenon flos-aquae NRERC-008]|uniref:site-specific DNA-methyltransferase (adenine-specific) n=1 Tax=Aphanizomenon flos-aquae FACHB-1249 TaxID=2692889 RepID=A0ABR8IRK5_APHFL|nr:MULTISPECIES: class I SAM-dependent DNA methyltransferase [Aphanizomenon]MBD2389789.1 SAM-dependent DNA methyltransferase [Aphanizomenon flos-aquae FACHB-1171]MBD2557541.1 SAM-dependent DNA methyltransferase [Aphanizomenon flos-aquae FACHB-1290]MBD2631327.1 SAM-dependent DNA methyltransferase [Aphanizomenon sp. FACHB-1399]MBD2643027.1 SAM-dependent DNA methyltransferase [Aphanizomenon sp. FACHB-1401]MBD2656022.1 SAM-dependent DNA methyltransferase [Aphanizomenon flos-aquae FACHB-1265]
MSISTTIKTIQDIMRKDAGVDGDAQRISQLVWMIFLKIFDDREAEYELLDDNYHSPIPEALRWRNWATDAEGITGDTLLDFVDNVLFKTLKDANTYQDKNPRGFVVRDVFEDAYNYMKNGTLIRQVINKLNEIDFNNSQDRHLFGDIYEQILRDLQSAGNAGEYYTPRAVTQFMVDMIDPKLGERILDPACGTGGFLTCALEHIKNKYVKTANDREKLHKLIKGVEKKPLPHLLCMTNMLLHGVEVPAITHDNTLSRPLRDYKPSDRVNVIITNPPFGGMEEDGIESGFPATFRTKETADLFLLLISNLLQDGGRGGIVLPDGTLFGEGVKTRIKEKLLEDCNLHTIVRLPNGVFSPYTGIKTNLLFFTKGEPTQEIWYYEHPYPPGYKSYSKTKPIRIEEFAPEKAWWDNRIESEFAWRVPIQVIKDNGYNLDIKNPHTVDFEHRDVEDMLEEYASLLADLGETRNSLKLELMTALGGEFV